ncbi:acetyl-CoA C-acetyltransferase [uncultured Psychrobacter sp.]|uniref:acetyl-CoA C-acetyltransferase n=1 Tax=uncultured Psychrobacter sp. TaxID=259303 RepID=UPI0034593B61
MSNEKNSPVVESTVVKGSSKINDNDPKGTDTSNKNEANDTTKNTAHYDSIAELKKATEIVDADGNPISDNDEQTEEQQKKAKIKEDLKQESNLDDTAYPSDDLNPLAQSDAAETSAQSEENHKGSSAESTSKKDSAQDDKEADDNTVDKAQTKPKQTSQTKLSPNQHRVAVLGGNRIPFARSNGPYSDASNIDMLTAALNGLIERYDLQGERVGEVVAGAVLKLSRDLSLTRESALNTALDPHTPAYDISQACGTGLQATFASANKIALGIIDSAITGGVDTTSDAPISLGDGLRHALIKLGAARNNKDRLKALLSINPKDLIDSPQNGEPRTGLSMGEHQAITTLEWNISREDQDELAFNSHKNLARAYDEGFFDDLITPYKGLTRDNNLRPDTTLEKLSNLKPVFGKKNANPTMTAANSTPLTDGASCVLLGNDEWAEAHGLKPLAYIVHQETAAVDFIGKSGNKEGLLMAPAYAVPRMLERAGLSLQDFDFYEIHEAFAAQVLSTLAAWEDETFCKERLGLDAPLGSIDRSKLNVNGSSLAAGHPFAATGGRILATAAKLLDQKGSGRALISICAAGGQGVTCILEK